MKDRGRAKLILWMCPMIEGGLGLLLVKLETRCVDLSAKPIPFRNRWMPIKCPDLFETLLCDEGKPRILFGKSISCEPPEG